MFWDHFQFWGEHLLLVGIWVSLALSLNLINGSTGLFSLGHQGFFGVGAYTAAMLVAVLPEKMGWGAPGIGLFLLSFPLAMLTAALFGLLVGVPCLRMRGDYLAIATLGFGEIFRIFAINSETMGQSRGLSVPNVVRAFFLDTLKMERDDARHLELIFYIALSWGLSLLIFVCMRNLMRSAHGRAIMAIREDETAAELLGVNLTRYKVLVFVLGAGMAGLSGAVYAHYLRYVVPEQFALMQGVIFVVIVVMGGMGSFSGTVIATIIIYFIPVLLSFSPDSVRVPVFFEPGRGLVYRSPKELWQVIFSLLLIGMILLRPQGIMGSREVTFGWMRKRAESAPGKGGVT
ncbi:MAG: branched-chain amino acid ABC transporter permease [Planctomycetota bacterium]|nr:branched-chain amino acid ABC transporter permease [Planctomycetota bacterium]